MQMMRNRIFAALASVVLGSMTSACWTADEKRLASDTAPSRDLTSWCQGYKPLGYAQADKAGQDDPGNLFDTDETVEAIQIENARYRAACPEGDADG